MESAMSTCNIKKKLGAAAAEIIQNNMVVGLGTGSTAECFIDSLIERRKSGLKVSAVATSESSAQRAQEGGIHVCNINDTKRIQITVDGADKIDCKKRLVKGLGGALLREKIVANASDELWVIADESKLVEYFNDFILPVEVIPFAWQMTMRNLLSLSERVVVRKDPDGNIFVTDNGNYILDLFFYKDCKEPEKIHRNILGIPGVVETGFFLDMPVKVIIGYESGELEIF